MKFCYLDLVPRFMRTWPWLRRYYWQADEIVRAEAKAEQWMRLFKDADG